MEFYRVTNEDIVDIEFAKPAFCIKTSVELFDNAIPVAIPQVDVFDHNLFSTLGTWLKIAQ